MATGGGRLVANRSLSCSKTTTDEHFGASVLISALLAREVMREHSSIGPSNFEIGEFEIVECL